MKARDPRTATVLPARVRSGRDWVAAAVREVSPHDLTLAIAQPPAIGAYVEVGIGAQMLAARVVWVEGEACGLHMRDRIDPDTLGAPAVDDEGAQADGRRATDPSRIAERSRRFAAAFQFAMLLVVAMTAAGGIGWQVYRALSVPARAVSEQLKNIS